MNTPTMPPLFRDQEERFWSLVEIRGKNECWPWLGRIHVRTGIPQISFRGRTYNAPRLAFLLTKGYAPPRLRHTCQTIDCCNPGHLSQLSRYRAIRKEKP